jgi:DNA-binding transcriptional regulator YdaS (Cro superfamily)
VGSSQSAYANAGELRAEVARRMVPIYRLAPSVGLHPAHLGQVLRGRRPLSPELESRIRAALVETDAADSRGLERVPA